MFQGTQTKLAETYPAIASAASINPKTDIISISGTAEITTIVKPNNGLGASSILFIIPTGAFTTALGGNIALASTGVVGKLLIMVYSRANDKWYPSY